MATRLDVNRTRAAWWIVGALLGGTLAFVLYSFVGTFVFGVFLYYATRPVHRRLGDRVGPPSLAAVLSLTLLALPALLLLAYTLAIGLQEASRILQIVDVGRLEAILQPYIDISRVARDPESILNEPSVQAAIEAALRDALAYIGFIGNALLHLFVMYGIAYYLLKDDRRLASWFRRRFADEGGIVVAYGEAVDRDFSRIFFGNIVNAAVTGVIGASAYNLLNLVAPAPVAVPYPTLLGLLAGIGSLIPVVGMKLVYFPVAVYLGGVAFGVGTDVLWFPVLFAAVSFLIVDTIPDFIVRPYISGGGSLPAGPLGWFGSDEGAERTEPQPRTRGLHLGMVMFAYIFGPLLFGWYGIFLGPMLLVCLVHFARLVLPELVEGTPIESEAVGDRSILGLREPSVSTPESESESGATERSDREPADSASAEEDPPPDEGGNRDRETDAGEGGVGGESDPERGNGTPGA
jgi:predicted PurR-regulated permease PerM